MTGTIPGVILAGGLSRRMGGGDKSLLEIAGRPILAHVVGRLEPQCGRLALNANGDPARFDAYGLPVVADPIEGFVGPLAGILAGLTFAKAEGSEWVATVAADTPFFPSDLVARLHANAERSGAPIALAATPDANGTLSRHPTFGVWSTRLCEDLEAAILDGTRKIVAWTDRHGAASEVFSADPFDPFFNVNTQADRARADELAAIAT